MQADMWCPCRNAGCSRNLLASVGLGVVIGLQGPPVKRAALLPQSWGSTAAGKLPKLEYSLQVIIGSPLFEKDLMKQSCLGTVPEIRQHLIFFPVSWFLSTLSFWETFSTHAPREQPPFFIFLWFLFNRMVYLQSSVLILSPPFLERKCSLWPGLAGIIPKYFLPIVAVQWQ